LSSGRPFAPFVAVLASQRGRRGQARLLRLGLDGRRRHVRRPLDLLQLEVVLDGVAAVDAHDDRHVFGRDAVRLCRRPWTSPRHGRRAVRHYAGTPTTIREARPMSIAFEDHVLLRDGRSLTIRPYRDDDRALLEELAAGLSPASVRLRFHSAGVRHTAERLLPSGSATTLVGIIGDELAGIASYAPLRDPTMAEIAVAVRDDEQGRGVGMRLVERIAEVARVEGIERLLAIVLPENRGMLVLLSDLGFRMQRASVGGEVEVVVDLASEDSYLRARGARDHAAAVLSLEPLLHPQSVAVVGASRRPGAVGAAILANIVAGGFPGAIYPINPNAAEIAGLPAYPSVGDAPGSVDLAIICLPAEGVLAAAQECVDAGVRGIVVIAGGFAETSPAGRTAQDALRDLCRRNDVRLLGPNCLGLLVNRPGHTLDATFAAGRPPTGGVAVASQSGALGVAILERARQVDLGLSAFASMGNKADISSNDLLEAWEEDADTRVIALYLESFGNPRRFSRIARRVAAEKPIVAVKAGRTRAGARAASTHTGALATDDRVVDALFRQAGVIRAGSLEELLDVLRLLSSQPLPAGPRIGVATNAGGLGILAADAAAEAGLELPELAAATRSSLKTLLAEHASLANPVDMLATATPDVFAATLRALRSDPGVDAVLALYAPTRLVSLEDMGAAIRRVADEESAKPLVAVMLTADGSPPPTLNPPASTVDVPSFGFPENAVRALAAAASVTAYRHRRRGSLPQLPDVNARVARTICAAAVRDGEQVWLDPQATDDVLRAFGIRTLAWGTAATPEEAAAAFESLGGRPAVVKLVSRTITHKTDVGGVLLGIRSGTDAAAAFESIRQSLAARGLEDAMEGVLVQELAPAGVECLAGVVSNPTFGPLVSIGAGGILAELAQDVAFRITPLTDVDADEMLTAVRVRRLLDGERGSAGGDVDAVRDVLLRLSELADQVPHIVEIDLNPLLALPAGQGAVAVDARIRVAPPPAP
jgi:acetyl coenzyme A synthetase (ADP forming)-like protein